MNRLMMKVLCLQLIVLALIVGNNSDASFEKTVNSTDDGSFDFKFSMLRDPFLSRYLDPRYNSFAGNGLLGTGWFIEAQSRISRCSDEGLGVPSEVDASELSEFCLDGKPLRLLENRNRGAVYTGKLRSGRSVKVSSYGSCGGLPCNFRVEDVFGEVRIYGGHDLNVFNGTSRWFKQDSSQVLSWALSRVTDGDASLQFDHEYQSTSTQHLLKRAIYTQYWEADGLYTQKEINFEYSDRHTDFVGEVDGQELKLSHVL